MTCSFLGPVVFFDPGWTASTARSTKSSAAGQGAQFRRGAAGARPGAPSVPCWPTTFGGCLPAARAVRFRSRLEPDLRAARRPAVTRDWCACRRPLSFPLWLSIAWHLAGDGGIPYDGAVHRLVLIMALLTVGVAVPAGRHRRHDSSHQDGGILRRGQRQGGRRGHLLHAASFIPVTLLGGLFMMQDGLNLARVRRMRQAGPPRRRRRRPIAEAHAGRGRGRINARSAPSRRQGWSTRVRVAKGRHPAPARVPGMCAVSQLNGSMRSVNGEEGWAARAFERRS